MQRTFLKSKIHRAVVTMADVNYMGSIAVDSNLLRNVGILPFEQVHVWDITSGTRFITYAIAEETGPGRICVNGAAARLVTVGDLIIIASFALVDAEELTTWKPKIALVDSDNRIEKFLEV